MAAGGQRVRQDDKVAGVELEPPAEAGSRAAGVDQAADLVLDRAAQWPRGADHQIEARLLAQHVELARPEMAELEREDCALGRLASVAASRPAVVRVGRRLT